MGRPGKTSWCHTYTMFAAVTQITKQYARFCWDHCESVNFTVGCFISDNSACLCCPRLLGVVLPRQLWSMLSSEWTPYLSAQTMLPDLPLSLLWQ